MTERITVPAVTARDGGVTTPRRVAVVGSGYVGTVVAACLAALDRRVVGVDADEAKVAALARGAPPFYEPGLGPLIAEGLASRRLIFTANLDAVAEADVVFLCVGTPSEPGGRADMRAVTAAAARVGRVMRHRQVIVTKSTVPIGSGNWLTAVVEDAQPRQDPQRFSVVSNPEFLRQGSAIGDFLFPDRVVLGSDDPEALDQVAEIYRPILEQSFPKGTPEHRPALVRTKLATAETVKYAANAFLATKVSFINEIAGICELVGADVAEVAAALGLDARIGPRFLDAGVGWGGSCFGKDLSALIALADDYGQDAPLLKAAVAVNARQRRVVVEKLRRHLKTLPGQRVGLLGLAFKPGTDDVRDAPALDIARTLLTAGAIVSAHDPVVRAVPELPGLHVAGSAYEAAERADALVLVTDWPEYLGLDFDELGAVMRRRLILDARNFLDPASLGAGGFVYESIGRTPSAARSAPPSPLVSRHHTCESSVTDGRGR